MEIWDPLWAHFGILHRLEVIRHTLDGIQGKNVVLFTGQLLTTPN